MDKIIVIRPEVAQLVDYLITMHSYDTELLIQLDSQMIRDLRKQVGRILVKGTAGELSLPLETLNYLLIITPITFRFGKEDVGYEFKMQLYEALIGRSIKLDMSLIKDSGHDTQNGNSNPSSD